MVSKTENSIKYRMMVMGETADCGAEGARDFVKLSGKKDRNRT
jgi:hypothetical protein